MKKTLIASLLALASISSFAQSLTATDFRMAEAVAANPATTSLALTMWQFNTDIPYTVVEDYVRVSAKSCVLKERKGESLFRPCMQASMNWLQNKLTN